MSKQLISIIIFVILLTFFINGFSESYTYNNIGNLAYVLALGIDVGESAKMKISAQFTKTASYSPSSGTSAEDDSNIVLVSSEADSIFSGLNLINSYIGKEINMSHCSVVIFSEEFSKQGISTEIFSLINHIDMRPSSNLLVSKCSAYDYLNNSNPNLEKMTVKYYDTFAITSKFTGYISNITIGDFYNNLSAKTNDSTAILGGLNSTARQEASKGSGSESSSENSGSSSEGGNSGNSSSESGSGNSSSSQTLTNNSSEQNSKEQQNIITNPEDLTAGTSSIIGGRGTENIGIAVFDKDKLCGELTAMEAICHLLITNDVDTCTVSIENPIAENQKTELQLSPKRKTNVKVELKNDVPKISIDVSLTADILTLEKGVDYLSEKNLEKISNATKDYIKKEMIDYLNKVSKEYNIDIDDFSTKALGHFSTISDWNNYDWYKKYENAKFDVNIDVNVVSSLLVTKT